MMTVDQLLHLPGEGVAYVGASPNSNNVIDVFCNLKDYGFAGPIIPVNPKYESVLGHRCYRSLEDVPDALSTVIIGVAGSQAPELVSRASERGCRQIVVIGSGFAEAGDIGLQRALVEACGPNVRLIGPNCMGFADFRASICCITGPMPKNGSVGSVSVISQSLELIASMIASLHVHRV